MTRFVRFIGSLSSILLTGAGGIAAVLCSSAQAQPVDVSYTKKEFSTRPSEQIRADADRLSAFPDHPDARRARHHLELHERPYEYPCRLIYANRDRLYHEVIHIDGTRMAVASFDSHRWMMMVPPDGRGAGVTVIEAGKPTPIIFDVSRLFYIQETVADLLFRYGVPVDATLIENRYEGLVDDIERVYRCDRTGFEYKIKIHSTNNSRENSRITTEIRTLLDSVLHERISLEQFRVVEGLEARFPGSVRIEHPLGEMVTIYDFASIEPISADSIDAYCDVPDASELEREGGRLIDASSPEMLSSSLASGVGTVTWVRSGDTDTFAFDAPVGEKVSYPVGPPAKGQGASSTRSAGRWLAMGLGAFLVSGVIALRWKARQ